MFDNNIINLNKELKTVKINLSEIIEAEKNGILNNFFYDGNIEISIDALFKSPVINIIANNKNYIIICDKINNNYNRIQIKLFGNKNGNLKVINNQNYKCDAYRSGEGYGNAILSGTSAGCAWRLDKGNGHAIKSGSGEGGAYRPDNGHGHAIRMGSGEGGAYRPDNGHGHAIRTGSGQNHARRTDSGNGHAIRLGSGAGDAVRNYSGHGHAIRSESGNGYACRLDNGNGHAIKSKSGEGYAMKSGVDNGYGIKFGNDINNTERKIFNYIENHW